MVPNYLSAYRVPPLAMLVLVLALFQGTSTTLALVYHFYRPAEPLISAVWLGTYVLATLGLFAGFGVNWVTWLVRYRLSLIILLAGVAASVSWSLDAVLTIERSIHLIGTTLIAFYIGFTVPLTRIVSVSAYVFTFLMAASVFMVFVFPQYGIEEYEGLLVWRGVMAAKNTLGFWACISCMSCVAMAYHSRFKTANLVGWVLAFGLSFTCLLKSESATSLLALGVSGTVVAGFAIAHRFRLGLISTLVLAVLAVGVITVLFQQINTAELIGRSGDLTGRGEVWSQTWQLILERPFTGYGYGTLWYPTAESEHIQKNLLDFTWVVFHAHNGFLQVASEVGLPLAFVAVILVVLQMIEVIYCQYQRQQSGTFFVLAFCVALLLSNYSEARFLLNRELYWIFFIAMPISMLHQVSVVLRDGQFNPLPVPLNQKQRVKAQERVAERRTNRKLKSRLKDARKINPEVPEPTRDGQVIDGQATRRRNKS